MTVNGPEAQFEKRRQLEKRLEQDHEDLELLQQSLTKTTIFTDKVVSLAIINEWARPGNLINVNVETGMLNRIDHRLGKLESFIIPIHQVTQKLAKIEERINQGKNQVDNVLNLYDILEVERSIISPGVINDNIDPFLTSLGRIQVAIQKLQVFKYKSSESLIQELKSLQRQGVKLLDSLFGSWIMGISIPLRPEQFNEESYPPMPEELASKLLTLTRWLVGSIDNIGSASNFAEIYQEFRHVFFANSLEALYKAAKEQEQLFSNRSARYEKGSTILLKYYQHLAWILQNEKSLVEQLFPPAYASAIYSSVIATEVDNFVEVGSSAHGRIKKGIQKKEYGDVLMLVDLWNGMSKNAKSDSLKQIGGVKYAELVNFKAAIVATIVSFVKSFIADFNSDPNKQSALASDGTIHEITSTTLNVLKRLVDYRKPISLILSQDQSDSFVNISSFAHLVSRILDALLIDIDIKSKGYKKPVFGAIFLLNNYHYILKNVKNSQLVDTIEPTVLSNLDKLRQKQMDSYRSSWIACVEFLMDSTNIQDGAIIKTLTVKQKEGIKDKFRGFNDTFEEFLKNSKTYTVPDLDLRAQLVNDIKAVLVPMYNRFLERYQDVEFSKNPEKYVKYKQEDLSRVLGRLYEETVS